MRQTIVITDLTQMKDGNYVCIVGINESGQCVRPVAEAREKGVPKDLLYCKSQLIIRPGARVEFDFHPVKVELPHVEDHGFDPKHIVSKGFCISTEWEDILGNSSYATVDKIYDGLLEEHKWVIPGANTKSTGTLARPTIVGIGLSESSVKPRLAFRDDTGHLFDCPASDLALWNLCHSSVKRQGRTRGELSSELVSLLQTADRVYLRLGLARPWRQSVSSEPRCYLQVTGVYTFPAYSKGKSFPD